MQAGAGTSDIDFPENAPEDIMTVVRQVRLEIQQLRDELKNKDKEDEPGATKIDKDSFEILKPIDVKDIEKPDKYDNDVKKFKVWFAKFNDLLANRHSNWTKLLKMIECKGHVTIKDQNDFFNDLDESIDKSFMFIKAQSDTYAQQLKSYLRTYTSGELHARVLQTDTNHIMELMRETIYKGKGRNPNKLIDLKAKALSPPKANKG